MSAFDSLKEFKEALKRYRGNDGYSYSDVCEDYDISSKGVVSKWFSPIIKGESNPEEVWESKTTGRGRSKKKRKEDDGKIENKEDWEVEGKEESDESEENRNKKIILIWLTVAIVIMIILYSVL